MYQSTPYSCAAAAIRNLLDIKGLPAVSEKHIMELCNTKPKTGCNNEDITRVLTSLGVEILHTQENGHQEELELFLEKDKILFVNYFNAFDNVGHYSLITHQEGNYFFLHDSIFGNFRLKKSTFLRHWHNTDKSIVGWYIAV